MSALRSLTIVYKDPAQLLRRDRNPRVHPRRQIEQIAVSIKAFGFVSPVLVDGADRIIAGHGRVDAAKLLGMRDVPTLCVKHLSPAQIRAYVIADNRLAELAGWDRKLLALELRDLSVEPSFDVVVTGFETAEIDMIIGDSDGEVSDEADKVPEINRTRQAISKAGDLWKIGKHRLLCGNALDGASYKRLLGERKAELIFTDPPYNLRITDNVSGRGTIKHPEFAMASGEMSPRGFTKFLRRAFENLCSASTDGSIHFVCMDWRHMRETLDASENAYHELKAPCIWTKSNAGMGSLYRSRHELVFVFKNGIAPHVNNVELGRFGRNRSNVWQYAGMSSFGKDRAAALATHPTVKPLAMVADAIMDCSNRGAIVLDAFAGSGTTLIAAERTGRIGYGIELDAHYVDAILKRFDDVFGLAAVHCPSNMRFRDLMNDR